MDYSLMPPRGIFIPIQMIFNTQLPPAVIFTWIQLRCLAWDGRVTPALNIQQLVLLTGKSQMTIFRHLSRLKSLSALDWCSTGDGGLIISFPAGQPDSPIRSVDISNFTDFNGVNSETLIVPEPAFYFPAKILGYLSY
jgi:hypothetical protein